MPTPLSRVPLRNSLKKVIAPAPTRDAYAAPQYNEAQDWDFSNPPLDQDGKPLGPGGQPLPPLAIGWRPSGTPDFGNTDPIAPLFKEGKLNLVGMITPFTGDSLAAWIRKSASNIMVSYESGYNEGFLRLSGEKLEPISQIGESLGMGKSKEIEALKGASAPKTDTGRVLNAWISTGMQLGTEALRGLFDILQIGAERMERYGGFVSLTGKDIVAGQREFTTKDLEENWNASQMAYTAILGNLLTTRVEGHPLAGLADRLFGEAPEKISGQTIEDRFTELVDSGIRPDMAEEIVFDENRWALWPELVGQLIFDPLNVIDAPLKAIRDAKRAGEAARMFNNAETVTDSIVALNKLRDAGKMIENSREAEEVFDGLVKAVMSDGGLITGHLDDLKTTNRVFNWSKTRYGKLARLQKPSRISNLANMSHDALNIIVGGCKTIDEQMEMFEAMAKIGSGVDSEVRTGVSTLLHFRNPGMAFSPAMQELGYFLSHSGDDILDIVKLGKDKSETVRMLAAKMDDIVANMYPGVSDMLKAEQKIKAAGSATEVITKYDKYLADAETGLLRKIPEWQKFVTKSNDTIRKPFQWVQSKFSYLQLNSPGYAFRNFFQNTETILVDEGFSALFGNADDAYARMSLLNGADIPGATGFGPQASFMQDVKGYAATKTGFKEAIKETVRKFDIRAGSNVLEAQGAKRIIAKSYQKQFDKMMKSLSMVARDSGISDDIVRRLPDLIYDNAGDVDKIMAKIIEADGAKVLDVFSDSSRVPEQLRIGLEDMGQWDNYRQVIAKDGVTVEEVKAAQQSIIDRIGSAATKNEVPPIVDDFVRMGVDEGAIGHATGIAFDQKVQANRDAFNIASQTFWDNVGELKASEVRDILQRNGVPVEMGDWGNMIAGGKPVQASADELRNLMVHIWKTESKGAKTTEELAEIWRKYPQLFSGPPPVNLEKSIFNDALFTNYSRLQNTRYNTARDLGTFGYRTALDDMAKLGNEISPSSYKAIDDAVEKAKLYEDVAIGRDGTFIHDPMVPFGTRSSEISQIAHKYGFATAVETKEGVMFLDKNTLKTINKWAKVDYKTLEEVPLSVAEDALREWAVAHGTLAEKIPQATRVVEEIAPEATKVAETLPPLRPTDGSFAPTPRELAQSFMDRQNDYKKMFAQHLEMFGEKTVLSDKLDIKKIDDLLRGAIPEMRTISSRVAQEARNFALLNYGEKTYLDIALSYIYPYHFWYGRTYANWVKRIATAPGAIAAYAKYKDNMALIHQDLPEWYKYNLNTNDLPGIHTEDPYYFNLEATLWPLNGITGVDFNDQYKRVDWWSNTLDYANRFGPTLFTPLQIATGLYYYQKGKREADDRLMEAGRRWMGRAIPQTKVIKTTTAKLFGKPIELDPLVGIVQNGVDPYEERQVSRALAAMQLEAQEGRSQWTPEQIMEAGYTKSGEIWDEALTRAMSQRAWPQLASFFLGVGFKGRTKEDMQTDQFYTEYSRLMTMRQNITTEEWRNGMTQLQHKYPFMDTLLVANKIGVERDSGYAYSVLSRIPPARSDDYAKLVGLDQNLLNKFWDDKGAIETWQQSDRDRFMSAILDLAAVLEIPDNATRVEWTSAKNAYTKLDTEAKETFGDDILDKVDNYYSIKAIDRDEANDYLDAMPEVQQYLDWKAQRILGSPLLSAYYGSIGTIEGYLKSEMYAEIDKTLGKDFMDVLEEYYRLQTYGEKGEADKFKKPYKEDFKTYYAILDKWQVKIDRSISIFSAKIPDVDSQIRQDFDSTRASQGAQQLAEGLAPQQVRSIEEWSQILTPELTRLIIDHLQNGEIFEYAIQQQMDRIAYDLGYYDADALVQAVGTSLYSAPR